MLDARGVEVKSAFKPSGPSGQSLSWFLGGIEDAIWLPSGGRQSGLTCMVSALDFGLKGLGSSPHQRHCLVLVKTCLLSHSGSLHQKLKISVLDSYADF